jgi:hypothetical protein
VNAEAFAGFADWRVPTKEEFLGIVDTGVTGCARALPASTPSSARRRRTPTGCPLRPTRPTPGS